jgi:hypothetical protein
MGKLAKAISETTEMTKNIKISAFITKPRRFFLTGLSENNTQFLSSTETPIFDDILIPSRTNEMTLKNPAKGQDNV